MKSTFLGEVTEICGINGFLKYQMIQKPIGTLAAIYGINVNREVRSFSMWKYAAVKRSFGWEFDFSWEYYVIRSDRISFLKKFQTDCWLEAVRSRDFAIIRWIFSPDFYRFVLYIMIDNFWIGDIAQHLEIVKTGSLENLYSG